MTDTLCITTDDGAVMTVRFDAPDKPVNTITPAVLDELDALVAKLTRGDEKPAGVIFASAKPGGFIAGADLFALRGMDRAQMEKFLEHGQQVFNAIAELPIPTVAAINGHCLGGGLELALACDYRVAADDGSINIGMPEIKLGILPGWGGTTRLPRLVGLGAALPLLLAGKTLAPRKALAVGVIDEVVRPEALSAAAYRLVRRHPPKHRPAMAARLVGRMPAARKLVIDTARRRTLARTWGNYPAAPRLIDVAAVGVQAGLHAGLDAERQAVLDLADTDACRNLMRLFFLRQDAKRAMHRQLDAEPTAVKRAAVVGGGTMGAGIIHAMVSAGIPVRLIEVNEQAVSSALRRVRRLLDDDVRAKRLSPLQAQNALRRVSPTTDWTGLKLVDLVVEAVVEKIDVKAQVFARLDELTRPDAVLATNTSSLGVGELAEPTHRPQRVIGLHFFNPVAKMPLVEVVRGRDSGAAALATGAALAQRLGKVPILVQDGPGFLVNRLVFPYLAEAMNVAAAGAPITAVDAAMKRWGMPMGPFELLDEVGLDVAASIFESAGKRLGQRISAPPVLAQVQERGWLGRKTGRGFYVYDRRLPWRRRRPRVNDKLVRLLRRQAPSDGDTFAAPLDDEAIQWRLLSPMINEAAALLSEGVTDSADIVDLATVLGLGLAPFRGGLVHFAESAGLTAIVQRMDDLAKRLGPRFKPIDPLRSIAQAQRPMQDLVPTGAAADNSPSPTDAPQSQPQQQVEQDLQQHSHPQHT